MKRSLVCLLLVSLVPSGGHEAAAAGGPDAALLDRNREFQVGADISLLQKIEDHGGVYRENGTPKDPLEIFKSHGFNYARLRLFHTPNMEGPTCNDLAYTLKLAERVKRAGFGLLLNFHYSDTWADPGQQTLPAGWRGLSFRELEEAVYRYTREVIEAFEDRDVLPAMVQIGNEINPGMLWPFGRVGWAGSQFDTPQQWDNLCRLLKAGIRGVADASGGRKIAIMIHLASGGDWEKNQWFVDNILARGVEFDVIGQSYYPWWHGTFDDLRDNLSFLCRKYQQDIIVVETAYFWRGPYSGKGKYKDRPPFPVSKQGQYDFVKELCGLLRQHPEVLGVFYWYPEATRCDPKAGLRLRGRGLFDDEGNALPAIRAFVD